MIRRRKGPGIVARKRIPSRQKPHYIMAYLWESAEAMDAGAGVPDAMVQEAPFRATGKLAVGLCSLASYTVTVSDDGETEEVEVAPLIAEVHFVKGRWREEVVAHELMHAAMHRMRVLPPWHREVCEQIGAAEETVCYEFGEWFDKVWRWLWEIDGYGKHAETKAA